MGEPKPNKVEMFFLCDPPAGLHPMARAVRPAYSLKMKKESFRPSHGFCLVLCATVLPVLVGCYVEPGRRSMRERPPSGYVEGGVIFDDDYVYYPDYEVYYSSRRHSYVYLDGRNWVTREAPPRVRVDVLLASPSVHVDFHDAPSQHHSAIVQQYPRNWKPAERKAEAHANEHKDERKQEKDDGKHN